MYRRVLVRMRIALLVSLFFALTIHAQRVSPIEHELPASGNPPALAVRGDRMLLAWSEIDATTRQAAIHTAWLDLDGRFVSNINTLPTYTSGVDATMPSVATNGSGFYVAWIENNVAAGIALDAAAQPIGTPRVVGASRTRPVLGSLNGSYIAVVGGAGFTIGADGTLQFAPLVIPSAYSYASNDTIVGVTWSSFPRTYRCISLGLGTCYWAEPVVDISWRLSRNGSLSSESYTAAQHATNLVHGGTDRTLAMAWNANNSIRGIRVFDGRYNSEFGIDGSGTPIAIAGDGEHFFVVMESNGHVRGAIIDRKLSHFDSFAITDGASFESNVQVVTLGPERFLVVYNRENGFASRIVMTREPSRRRAIR